MKLRARQALLLLVSLSLSITAAQIQTSTRYRILSSAAIKKRLAKLQVKYPQLIRVDTAQAKYGFDVAGDKDDCPHENGKGCINYFATIQDFGVHPAGSDSSNRLPAVLLSGALHGDERVGPTAVIETAELILLAATCEAEPTLACKNKLKSMGVTDDDRRWLARLVTTRRLVIVPTPNALGYYKQVREEGSIDVNRDFPFDVLDPTKCMRSIAARTLNELYREDQFQMSITFHGGMEVIAYEWGATSYDNDPISPDDKGQDEIAAAMSRFGGSFKGSEDYPYGVSNILVYGVRGGMEDWAYAGSWDNRRMVQCKPTTFGSYPTSRTQYDSGTLRSFIMLVETSNDKIPALSSLGRPQQIMNPTGTGSGHVSRNIRVALLAMDLVEPYLTIESVNGNKVTTDLLPMQPRSGRSCQTERSASVKKGTKVTVSWSVGGAITVDDTQIWFARWEDVPKSNLDCIKQPSTDETVLKYMNSASLTSQSTGTGRFSPKGETIFTAIIDLKDFNFGMGDQIVVLAGAKVDSSWAQAPDDSAPVSAKTVQSHIANVRTNPSWLQTDNGKIIQGRDYWYSPPLTLTFV